MNNPLKDNQEQCPLCHGTGEVEPNAVNVESRWDKVKELHQQGYSLRQIKAAVGYANPSSVQYALARMGLTPNSYKNKWDRRQS